MKESTKRLGFATLLAVGFVADGIYESHRMQIENIHKQCEFILRVGRSENFPEVDIEAALDEANKLDSKQWDDEGGMKFIIGDFDHDKKARCGGVAHKICEYLSFCGFRTSIVLEGFHYFPVVGKGDREWKILGSPPSLRYEEVD